MEEKNLVSLARAFGRAIQQDPMYLQLNLISQQNDENQALQDKIGRFNMLRVDLNREVTKSDKDDAKVADLNEKIGTLYRELMEEEGMKAYAAAKDAFEEEIGFVMQILQGAVNGQDPDTIEKSASCSGSCGSCGGCH